jgi:hypothetical protein
MKNAQHIILSLQDHASFAKLAQVHCIQTVQNLLLPSVQRYILFGYIKNDTLFFVFNHNAGKQEFDNNIQSIKSALRLHTPKECVKMPKDIKGFVSHKFLKATQPFFVGSSTPLHFHERARGEFTNSVKDTRLSMLFEEIRTIVHAKND